MNALPANINADAARLPQTYEAAKSGFIYAIGSESLVKIGFSRNPMRRLAEIQSLYGACFVFVGACPATMQQEREAHRLLAHARLAGELFFRSDPTVASFINQLDPGLPSLSAGLLGFDSLECGYEVERDGSSVVMPISELSDDELYVRARDYEEMSKGCLRHAYEIREFVRARSHNGVAA